MAENAAYNPSMSPLEQAVVNLVISGGKSYADIADAVLVEVKSAKASQIAATRAVLSSITSVPCGLSGLIWTVRTAGALAGWQGAVSAP